MVINLPDRELFVEAIRPWLSGMIEEGGHLYGRRVGRQQAERAYDQSLAPLLGSLMEEVGLLRRQVSAIEELIEDASKQPRTEIIPVRGLAALLRGTLAGHTQANYIAVNGREGA
jgi:hypothetical protein